MIFRQWPFQEAEKILKRNERTGKNKLTLETGYGPSGLPHIGTFGEVARTVFVIEALKTLEPSLEVDLIVFSDDLDGLRDLPSNLPNTNMLREYLGRPLTMLPDPFGIENSFAGYMNSKLKEFLDSFEFKYKLVSSTKSYRSGIFDDPLKKVMDNKDKIIKIFTETISKEKRDKWSPFFPICEECLKIYSTKVLDYDPQNYSLTYICEKDSDTKFEGCGYQGSVSILNSNVKLGWKIDWAARWLALDIDYEMHGEDLIESARLSSKIVRILGGTPPELFKYELFLDENGSKISKKIGNGISIEKWLNFAPYDSLLYFMYDKPQKPKRMGLPILPQIVDQYLATISDYKDKENKDHPAYFIIGQTEKLHASENLKGISYSLIYNLLIALSEADEELILGYLLKYQPSIKENIDYYKDLIRKVINYYQDYYMQNKEEILPTNDLFDETVLFREILTNIDKENENADYYMNITYNFAKEKGINLPDWFKHLYAVILGSSSGPKIGSFIELIGKEKVAERLDRYINSKS